jgi:uncharacterized oligopeptide transporter (OPT) family protein
MLIAVGMYLPFDTSSAIFLGGAIQWIAARLLASRDPEERQRAEDRGTLLASGLIAGEAIMGIVLAVLFVAGVQSLGHFGGFERWGGWLSLLGFGVLMWLLVRVPARRA